jgi:hypothetical protein
MSVEKHPWESNEELQRGRVTREEIESLIQASKKNEEKRVKRNPAKVSYHMIDGIPHKMVNGKYVPLKKL